MSDDWVDELRKVVRLRRLTLISPEEFAQRKAELLGLPASEPKVSLPDSKPEAAQPEPGEGDQAKITPYRLSPLARVVMGCHTAHLALLLFLVLWTHNFEIRGNYNFHYWPATAVVQLTLMATSTVFCYRAWFNSFHFGYFRRLSHPDRSYLMWLFPEGTKPIWPAPSSAPAEPEDTELAGQPPLPQQIEDFLVRKFPRSKGLFDRLWYLVASSFFAALAIIALRATAAHPFGSQSQAFLVQDLTFPRGIVGGSFDLVYVSAVLIWSVAGFFTVWRIATAHDQRANR